MEELIERLKNTCEELELITELTLKYKDIQVVGEMLLYKKMEDGILNKLMTASISQLELLKRDYYFRYYKKDITNKLIDIAIKNVTRRNKLNKLNNIEKSE